MQGAETVLSVIRERGRKGLPLERLYRQMFNRELFLAAYGRIYSNAGSMTPGVSGETADGMSLAKIDAIIGALRSESYRWRPAKRVYIPKKNGKLRPLGMTSWSDKLVAEVVRMLLDAYYDVQFSDRSHGFRPGRGCHTALMQVQRQAVGAKWFIEGDLSDFFGSLDHQVLTGILAENIHDGRFLQLIDRMLKAGYLEDWRWHASYSGAPQGGIASPVMSNVYLDRFDRFVEQQLIPRYTRGDRRRADPEYVRISSRKSYASKHGDHEAVRALARAQRAIPSKDTFDPGFRRLTYTRYADDFILGFAGSKHEAEQIKAEIREFLRDELALELSEPKTLITHAASQAARFLGYEIRVQHRDTKITDGRRAINGIVALFVPADVIRQRCAQYMRAGKPASRGLMTLDTDFTIVERYGSEYRGYVQYYLLAQNVYRLGRLRRVMEVSMFKTLALKHKSTVSTMARRYKASITTPDGPRTCFQVSVEREGRKPLVARFGGIPLKRRRTVSEINDRKFPTQMRGNELIHRLLAGQCEMCASRTGLQVHHVRKLADLGKPGQAEPSPWKQKMASRRRKTLVVCERCHHDIHAGRAMATTRK